MKDWKIIFNTKSYNYIFIKQLKDNNYLKYYFDNIEEIKSEKTFFILMPSSLEELNIQDANFFVKKYANDLKFFIDSPETITLFTEEDILKSIIKEDKRANFFKLLTKKKKNILYFIMDNLFQNFKNFWTMHYWNDSKSNLRVESFSLLSLWVA